ncbi:hypothetical protein HanPI659440_Chr16g0638641 [Helianthus annuus]|nr:hypothetical protein HanPI659440_Chr16g0638641 [Helianthus annuus]
MGRISTIWPEPECFPTIRWNGEVMGLKEALRLKSFDSSELDIHAKKTPKGDPPYLSIVNENLYKIREPTVLAGQGGSSSAPPTQAVNVVSVRRCWSQVVIKGKEQARAEPGVLVRRLFYMAQSIYLSRTKGWTPMAMMWVISLR